MRRALLATLALLAALPSAAREPAPAVLKKRIDAVTGRSTFAAGWWGVQVRSLRSGKVLYALNDQRNFMPASTMKLVTTAAILDALGPEEKLRTTVETAGRLDSFGRLLGDVYLVGRGDPNLSGRFANGRATAALEELADALKAAGVRRIEGRLLGNESLFSGDRRGERWGWADLVWCYGAEVSALSFNDNCVTLTAAPGERVGDAARIEPFPLSRYYQVVSTATTSAAGTEQQLRLERDLGTMVFRLSGTLPLGGPPWEGELAVENPARFTATVFAEVLETRGIRVTGPVEAGPQPLPAGLRVLAAHEGPPLAQVLQGINKPSQNLHAETMLRLLGARVKKQGSVEAGLMAEDEFLKRARVDDGSWSLHDGSGLSRTDLVTPRGLVDLLAAMDKHRFRAAYLESLPIAGVDGTLENRMKGSPAQGRIRAKTGTLTEVNALAGYADAGDGDRLAFAIVLNHHAAGGSTAVGAIDEIAKALVSK